MRLIDADKLIEICRKGWRLFGFSNEKICHWVDEYDINAQPTVEAIPIDWLKKKCNEADNMGMGIDDWSVKDCYELVLEYWGKEKDGKDL